MKNKITHVSESHRDIGGLFFLLSTGGTDRGTSGFFCNKFSTGMFLRYSSVKIIPWISYQ